MSKSQRQGAFSGGGIGFAFRSIRPAPQYSESRLKAVCDAARSAMQAFDESAARGDAFADLSELSELEHRAVMTACAAPAATPAGLAEKALLLDRIAAGNPPRTLLEAFARSLAADAAALARSLAAEAARG